MSIRPFYGTQTVSGSVQPVFGTAVTAAVTPPADQFSGQLGPGSNETQTNLTVTSTKGFLPGDRVAVGLTAAFKPGIVAAGSIPDQGQVKSITSSTVMVVQGLKNSHAATGEWCVLNDSASSVHIRPVVTAAAVYIGNASTVSSSDVSLLDILPIVAAAGTAPGYVFDTESAGVAQPVQLSEFWLVGTANDTFLARFVTL